MNTCLNNRQVLKRWTRAHTVLLPKDKGSRKVHRFRNLQIVEADANMLVKHVVARQTLGHAEDKHLIPDEQWGGRPGRSCTDLGVDKTLTIEYAMLTRTPLGVVELDATACYDRIVKTVGVIGLLLFGMGSNAERWFLAFLDAMRYKITISGKVAKESFPADNEPHEGAGQGLTGAGGFWTGTDSAITMEYHKSSHPAILSDPMGDDTIEKDSTTFIDDRTLYTNGGDGNEVREKLQENVRTVQNLLSATGGALNMMKSSYAIIGEEMPPETDTTLLIQRPECETIQITTACHSYVDSPNCLTAHRLEKCIGSKITADPTKEDLRHINQLIDKAPLRQSRGDDGIRSLGFWYSPDGKSHSAEKIINQLNKAFVNKITQSTMDKRLIIKAYEKKHLPKIAYILHDTNPSSEFLEKETNFITSTILPKLGLNRHTPLAIRHCPNDRLGLELPHLYSEAGYIQTKQWLKNVRKRTKIGRELIINLKWAQLRSGIAESIYVDTKTNLPHLPMGRTKWLREFSAKIDGSLHCEEITIPPSNCENEYAIMDLILGLNLGEKEIVDINEVREHFKVYWASDILDLHKQTILPFYLFNATNEVLTPKYS